MNTGNKTHWVFVMKPDPGLEHMTLNRDVKKTQNYTQYIYSALKILWFIVK